MKTTLRLATVIAAATLASAASATQAINITTFNIPYRVTNSTNATLPMQAECALFIGRRLVSHGTVDFAAAPGMNTGSASVGMHWPLSENPSRINQFACRIIERRSGLQRMIDLPEAAGPFSLPHAGPRGGVSYVSGNWPQ